MTKHYEYYLFTGSGWTQAVLTFSNDGMAWMYFDSRWMGSELERFRLTWRHDQQSQVYGFLKLQEVQRYVDVESDSTITEDLDQFVCKPDFDENRRALYRHIAYEYVLLPQSEAWIGEDPSLEEMASFGWASWHDKFDLIVFLHFSVAMLDGPLRETRLGSALSRLDKMKFKAVTDSVLGYARIQELNRPSEHRSNDDIPF